MTLPPNEKILPIELFPFAIIPPEDKNVAVFTHLLALLYSTPCQFFSSLTFQNMSAPYYSYSPNTSTENLDFVAQSFPLLHREMSTILTFLSTSNSFCFHSFLPLTVREQLPFIGETNERNTAGAQRTFVHLGT